MAVTEELLPWETVSSRVKNDNELIFGRTKGTMDSYLAHKAKVNREWRDINSYCKHRMLGYPYSTETVTNEKGMEELRKYVPDDADCPGERVKIMENEFPYAFSSDVLHKVIWSADELTIEEYRRHLNKHFSDADYEIEMYINPPQLKSVPGVHHGHGFMRKRQTAITDLITQNTHQSSKEYLDCR